MFDWPFGKGKKRPFRYTFLCFQRSLDDARGERVAIVAETPFHNGNVVLTAGRDVDTRGLDPLSERILNQLEDWLDAQVREAADSMGREDETPVTVLVREHPWNLHFTEPEVGTTDDFLRDVLDLFATEVLGLESAEALVGRRGRFGSPGFTSLKVPGLSERAPNRAPRRPVPAGD